MRSLKFKQYIKMLMQNVVFPFFYMIGKKNKIESGLVIFADSHHNSIPYSMEDLYEWFKGKNYKVVSMVRDCDGGSYASGLIFMLRFMLLYARAEYVFICDTFLPVSSCRKRKETTVVQMWHAAGMLKKFGYDTTRDIPAYYHGEVYRNYSLIITSGEACKRAYVSGMHADRKCVKALGLSRTDRFWKKQYLENCVRQFQELYPEYANKKIVLWAPTFRGNAANPKSFDFGSAERLQKGLGEEWCVLLKLHPHVERYNQKQSCKLPTEQLLPVADILISDYSSVIFDFLILEKPIVLYAPDLQEYERNNELYIDYYDLPGYVVQEEETLAKFVREVYTSDTKEDIRNFRMKYMEACDGKALERLVHTLGLTDRG